MIEASTARVLARLSDETRPAILDVAERLVREEIERIKSSGNLEIGNRYPVIPDRIRYIVRCHAVWT